MTQTSSHLKADLTITRSVPLGRGCTSSAPLGICQSTFHHYMAQARSEAIPVKTSGDPGPLTHMLSGDGWVRLLAKALWGTSEKNVSYNAGLAF